MNKPTTSCIRVAVTDDHQLWHDQLNVSLPEFGFEVIINAHHGQELLDMLSSAAVLPDVCLLDISMPVMNGFMTARELKALYPAIKILAFSLDDDEQTVSDIKKAGADGFIWKCCKLEELNEAIQRLYNS